MTNANNFVIQQHQGETLPPLREHLAEQWYGPAERRTVLYRDGQPSPDLSGDSVSPILTPIINQRTNHTPATSSGSRRSKGVKRSVHGSGTASDRTAKRACSLSTSASDDNDEQYDDRRSSNTPTNGSAKADKERKHRYGMAVMLHRTEDACRSIFPDIDNLSTEDFKAQIISNGNTSGLRYDKRNFIQFVMSTFVQDRIAQLLEAEKEDAIASSEGRRPTAVESYHKRIVDAFAASARADDVLANTVFVTDHPNDYCHHRKDEKSCCVHPNAPGADDWRDCRFNRLKATMDHNCNVQHLQLL